MKKIRWPARFLYDRGLRLSNVREEMVRQSGVGHFPPQEKESPEAIRLWREALVLMQEKLSATLQDEAAVADLERHTDLYLSMLREQVTKLGGSLEINVRFPEGTLQVEKFEKESDRE